MFPRVLWAPLTNYLNPRRGSWELLFIASWTELQVKHWGLCLALEVGSSVVGWPFNFCGLTLSPNRVEVELEDTQLHNWLVGYGVKSSHFLTTRGHRNLLCWLLLSERMEKALWFGFPYKNRATNKSLTDPHPLPALRRHSAAGLVYSVPPFWTPL